MAEREFPDWAALTPELASERLPGLLDAAERGVAAVEASEPRTFEDLEWRVADAIRPLWDMWGMVGHMASVANSDAWRRVEEGFQPRLVAFSLRVGQSRRLYEHSKAVLRGLDPSRGGDAAATRARILAKSVESAELAGVGLDGAEKDRFNEIQASLAKLGSDFRNAVMDATAAFKLEKDGKTYTIDDASYPETMKHCADRDVRERLFRARVARAPENAARIAEILALRREMAALLGYPDYASLSLASKCAPSVAAVRAMIDSLDEATAARAAEEAEEIGGDAVRPWDVAYEAERLRERRYAYSEEDLKRCFGLDAVLAGIFRVSKFLFGVDVVELAGDARPPVWHPDVRFFAVREGGETVAHFYFDPYVRPGEKSGGAWMNEFSNRCDRLGKKPLAVVVTNLPAPGEDGVSHLPFREVETLFHEFGHALQCMLTRVGEEGAAGISLVEWDAVEVASQFMENWCLDDRTGIEVPADLKAKVRAAKNFRAASACRRQLAFSKIDLDLHEGAASPDPDAVVRGNFAHFGTPTIPEDRFLCAFSHIFAGAYAAGYYGYKWAEVMSADCYGAFEEAGLGDDGAMRRVGAEYRETVLALGGSVSALDVFRRFRGRDPEPDALLRQQGLLDGGRGKERRGFTLLEVLLAALMLGLGLAGILVSMSQAQKMMMSSTELETAKEVMDLGDMAYPLEEVKDADDIEVRETKATDLWDLVTEERMTSEQREKFHGYVWEREDLDRNISDEDKKRMNGLHRVRITVTWGERGKGRGKAERETYVTLWREPDA
ncbi:MAG: M3 family metallopeptidase [Kiritimatiellae bacterium]|nr:M3 family metallopeptidase [Kiritimatiellia bacterium]